MEVNQILEKLSQLELKIDEQNLLKKEVLNFNEIGRASCRERV